MSDGSVPQPGGGLRVLVIDDNLLVLGELAWLLEHDDRVADVETACTGADARDILARGHVDVVFTDVRVAGLDGLELARSLNHHPDRPQIVFVTACEAHAVDAFEVMATDYLVKPVRAARLAESIRKVIAAEKMWAALAPPPPPEDETIPVELGGVTTFVQRSEVIYVTAQGDYARLHTQKTSHLIRMSLSALEERWAGAGFARIHRSTLVSLPAVTQVRTERGRCVVVLGEVELQVSRRNTRELREKLLRLPRP